MTLSTESYVTAVTALVMVEQQIPFSCISVAYFGKTLSLLCSSFHLEIIFG